MTTAKCADCGVEFDSKAWNDLWCAPCGERVRIAGERLRADDETMWQAAGFSSDEAQRLSDSGFFEVDDLKPWIASGFNIDEAIRWSEFVSADWDSPGRYELGDHTNLTLAEVAAWRDAGFLPRQVETWMDLFSNPFEAGEWRKRGVGAHEALEVRDAGRSPEAVRQERDARRRRERGPTRQEEPDTFWFVAERCTVALGGSPTESMWVGSGGKVLPPPNPHRITFLDVTKVALGDDAIVRRSRSDGAGVARAVTAVISQHVNSGLAAALFPKTTTKMRWTEVQHLCGAGRRWSRDMDVSFLAGRVEALLEPFTGMRTCSCRECNQ